MAFSVRKLPRCLHSALKRQHSHQTCRYAQPGSKSERGFLYGKPLSASKILQVRLDLIVGVGVGIGIGVEIKESETEPIPTPNLNVYEDVSASAYHQTG